MDRKLIYIDRIQQSKEKNVYLGDYPVFNYKTGCYLKHRFSYYFTDLSDYYATKNSNYLSWSDEYKCTSQEANLFFEDVLNKEYRC